MSYIYNQGLAGIWGHGALPSIKISDASGSFILPGRADYYGPFMYGRPYIGQKPPLPLFSTTPYGKAESPFTKFTLPPMTTDIIPATRPHIKSSVIYEVNP